ncbi:MAG TPA: energy transducer TonB [Puia sp.]|nr:energy transducer TonB [Puia sp.]
MDKKISGILFGILLLLYLSAMIFSYTACNSGNEQTATSSTIDTSKNKSVDSAASASTTKKTRKGKAMISSTSVSPGSQKMKVHPDKDGIYSFPQIMPQYPGGQAAMSQYVENNLSYPEQALNDSKEGIVRISFIVDEKGIVSDPQVVGNKLGDGLDEEAINVIKKMPKWKPGTVHGKNVKTRIDLPIKFQLEPES